MELTKQAVRHKSFGAGIVVNQTEKHMTVQFRDSEKRFCYPDAFKTHLVLKDPKLQQHVQDQLRQVETAKAEETRRRLAEQERKRKLLNFKRIPNSHLAFHVPPEQAEQSLQALCVSTGKYLSGYCKGQPRIADRAKPNSLCLLTTRAPDRPEAERYIFGVFMVQADFFGEEDPDGRVYGHAEHHLLLPEKERVLFWQATGQEAPLRWGSVAFKYCADSLVHQLLAETTTRLRTTAQAQQSRALYEYFCKMNQLSPLPEPQEEDAYAKAGQGDF